RASHRAELSAAPPARNHIPPYSSAMIAPAHGPARVRRARQRSMSFIPLYFRVFAMLAPEKRLGVVLAFANVGLAAAQFAEPVLFGWVIDVLVGAQAKGAAPSLSALTWLLGLWGVFGLFSIAAGVMLALHADRLAHRRRLGIITTYFEHVLQLP